MRVVVDTNVLVAGLLTPFNPPGVIVGLIAAGRLTLCYDMRMIAEYDEVLRRPAFPFKTAEVAAFLAQVRAGGVVAAGEPLKARLPHPDDEPFLEVALSAPAEFLVTGNLKHFPRDRCQGVRVVSPREFMDRAFGNP